MVTISWLYVKAEMSDARYKHPRIITSTIISADTSLHPSEFTIAYSILPYTLDIKSAGIAPIAAIPFAIISFMSIPLPIIALTLISGWRSRGKGLIITASIFLIIALFLSFAAGIGAYSEIYTDDDIELADSLLDRAGSIANIDFPDVYDAYTYDYEYYDPQSKTYLEYTLVSCYLDDEENEYLKSQVEQNDIWLTETSDEMDALIGRFFSTYYDPFIIVNLTEGTFNDIPHGNTDCHYVIINYNSSSYCISIYSFTISGTGIIPSTPDSLSA